MAYIGYLIGHDGKHITLLAIEHNQQIGSLLAMFDEFVSTIAEPGPMFKAISEVDYWPEANVTVAILDSQQLADYNAKLKRLALEYGVSYKDNYEYISHITLGEGQLSYSQLGQWAEQYQVLLDKLVLIENDTILAAAYAHSHTDDLMPGSEYIGGEAYAETPQELLEEMLGLFGGLASRAEAGGNAVAARLAKKAEALKRKAEEAKKKAEEGNEPSPESEAKDPPGEKEPEVNPETGKPVPKGSKPCGKGHTKKTNKCHKDTPEANTEGDAEGVSSTNSQLRVSEPVLSRRKKLVHSCKACLKQREKAKESQAIADLG